MVSRLLCLILVVSPVLSYAQKPETERLDSFLHVMAQHGLFNGTIVATVHGEIVYEKSIGLADRATGALNSDTTPFNLASMSKPFTSLAVLQLVQKGKLHLGDHFVQYFPDFPYPDITIRQLLNHTSGLPQVEMFEHDYMSKHPDEVISGEEAYRHMVVLNQPLQSKPGEKMTYSNMGYACLALLVAKVSKMPFGEYLEKNIFLPSNMHHTYLRASGMADPARYTIPAMYMTEHRRIDSLDRHVYYTYYNLGYMPGPGSIVSTPLDILQFDRALASGKLLSASLMDSAFSPTVLGDGKVAHMRGNGSYGFGWNVIRDPGKDTVVYHDGHIPGIVTMLYRNLTRGLTIVYYDNMDSPLPLDIVGAVSRILTGTPLRTYRIGQSLARVYGEALVTKGVDYATTKFNACRDDTVNYYLEEMEINRLGYDLLGASGIPNHKELALEAFKLNTLVYHSANSYDSYADALREDGKKEDAIVMYQKSLAMNPNNPRGAENLKNLLAAPTD
jgi:CubicO group peptidase (beta-lactamase class C family)